MLGNFSSYNIKSLNICCVVKQSKTSESEREKYGGISFVNLAVLLTGGVLAGRYLWQQPVEHKLIWAAGN